MEPASQPDPQTTTFPILYRAYSYLEPFIPSYARCHLSIPLPGSSHKSPHPVPWRDCYIVDMNGSSYLDHALSNSTQAFSDHPSPTTDKPVDENEASVGLAHPEKSQGRRRMLDLVNRLHNTG